MDRHAWDLCYEELVETYKKQGHDKGKICFNMEFEASTRYIGDLKAVSLIRKLLPKFREEIRS